MMAPTQSPVASILPSCDEVMLLIASVWPLQTSRSLPVATSRNVTSPGDSMKAKDVANHLLSGAKAAA